MNHGPQNPDRRTGWSHAPTSRQGTRQNPFRFLGGLLVLLVFVGPGCKRQSENAANAHSGATNQTSQSASRGVPVAPTQIQPQTLEVPPDADPSVVVDELNRELRRWVMRNRRRPANFEEFVSSAQMQVPPPPSGKKYTLTKEMRIELVNR